MENDFHDNGVEDKKKNEQPEQLGKEFMSQFCYSPLGSSNR